ncbi:SWIM-type domain-containing protein [Gammaproteobacteria bacterium]
MTQGSNMARGSFWAPYVPVAERRRKAAKKVATLKKQGQALQPVMIAGRAIATTFWGRAWCDNLEVYSDWANRLPRGRTYVRNGSVLDLQLEAGKITALVMGSELYRIDISVKPLEAARWQGIQSECAGKVDSLIELLQGKLSRGVMEIITRPGSGLFPQPREIQMHCSCPDYASLCKHLAAVLYGVGARLDLQPELLFMLRQVDHRDLIAHAVAPSLETSVPGEGKRLDESGLASLFGIDLAGGPEVVSNSEPVPPSPAPKPTPKPSTATHSPRRKSPSFKPTQVTSRELTARGIPVYTVQNWLASGVLTHTGVRGAYATTAQTEQRIQSYLKRKNS